MRHSYRRTNRPFPELQFRNLSELANRAEMTEAELRVFLSIKDQLYRNVELHDRKTGKHRKISMPSKELKNIQRAILSGIQPYLPMNRVRRVSHAYTKRRSIVTAGKQHPSSKSGFKLDLADYFTSISQQKILENWGSLKPQAWKPDYFELIEHITALATRRNAGEVSIPLGQTYLPQGAPTSGLMANIATRGLDVSLWKVAREYKMRVTRYSDDILFTSAKKLSRETLETAMAAASNAITQHGFTVNHSKTRLLLPGSRFEVLGLMLGSPKPRLSRAKRRRIESDIRGIAKFGLESHARERGTQPELLLNRIGGYLAFSARIEPEWSSQQKESLARALTL